MDFAIVIFIYSKGMFRPLLYVIGFTASPNTLQSRCSLHCCSSEVLLVAGIFRKTCDGLGSGVSFSTILGSAHGAPPLRFAPNAGTFPGTTSSITFDFQRINLSSLALFPIPQQLPSSPKQTRKNGKLSPQVEAGLPVPSSSRGKCGRHHRSDLRVRGTRAPDSPMSCRTPSPRISRPQHHLWVEVLSAPARTKSVGAKHGVSC